VKQGLVSMSWIGIYPEKNESSIRLDLRVGFWVAAVAVLAFLPAIGCDFVNMDDLRNFQSNAALNYPLGKKLVWAWTTCWLGVYQPLAWILIFCEHAAWALRPCGYHGVSLALHGMVGVALFVVTRMLLERAFAGTAEQKDPLVVVAAGLAAMLFCVHPLRTEVVVWLSAQPYLPSVLCLILGVGAYLKAFDANRALESRRKWLMASFLLGGAAMLFKAVAVTFPLLLLVLDVYPLGRLTLAQGESGARRRWTLALVEKLPLLVLGLMLMVVAHGAKNHPRFETGDPISAPLSARLADAAYGVWFYPSKTLVPIGLTIVYPREENSVVHLTEPSFALCAAGVVAMCLLAWLLRRKLPAFAAAWVAYLIILAPSSGLVRFSPQLAADRYSYAASLPWVAVLAVGLVYALKRRASIRITSTAIVAVVVLGLSAMSWFQTATWRHSVALWNHALDVGSDRSLEAHGNLALALKQVGFETEAFEQYQAAVRIAPRSSKACYYLADELARQGKNAEAIATMREAVQAAPDQAMMHYYLASFLMRLGQPDQALVPFREAIRLEPGFCEAHRDLGVLLAVQGQNDEARYHLEKALQIRPNDPEARSNLEQFLVEQENGQRREQQPATSPAALPSPKASSQVPAGKSTFASPTLMDRSCTQR
jgi:protein O-mannosyl-transferase